jgi:hypothetical protein
MQNKIHLARNVDEIRDVAAKEPEARITHQMLDIGWDSGEEVVQTHDLSAQGQQLLAQVRPEKA